MAAQLTTAQVRLMLAKVLNNNQADMVSLLEASGVSVPAGTSPKDMQIMFLQQLMASPQFRADVGQYLHNGISGKHPFVGLSKRRKNFVDQPQLGFALQPGAGTMDFVSQPAGLDFVSQPSAMSFVSQPAEMAFVSQPSAMGFAARKKKAKKYHNDTGDDTEDDGTDNIPAAINTSGALASVPSTSSPAISISAPSASVAAASSPAPAASAPASSSGTSIWSTLGSIFTPATDAAVITSGLGAYSASLTAQANATTQANALKLEQYKLAQTNAQALEAEVTAWPTWTKALIALSVAGLIGIIIYKINKKKSATA